MKRLLSVSTLLAASCLAACAGIFGFDRLEAGSDTPQEAGSDANPITDAGSDADAFVIAPGCDQLGIPAPPTVDASTDQKSTIWMAFDLFDLGISFDGGAPTIVGYNLDLTCTSSEDTSSCTSPGTIDLDLPNPPGLDNSGARLISVLSVGSPFSADNVNSALVAGDFGALISLDRYNGEANDPDVKVNFFPAVGTVAGGAPSFTRSDRWRRDRNYNPGGGVSAFQSTGYITNNVLVAKFNDVTVEVPIGDKKSVLKLHLTSAVMTGRIVQDDADHYHLTDGALAARWGTPEMLLALGALDDTHGKGACDNPQYAGLITSYVCAAADLAPTAAQDVGAAAAHAGAKKVPCAAMSVGARFDSYAVDDDNDDGFRADAGTTHACDAGFAICP